MIEEGIYLFLYNLGVDANKAKTDTDKKWVCLPCPLAFHMHESGEDKRPSFFISISEDKPSIYHCFGCTENAHGLIWLLHNWWLMTGKYPYKAAKIYSQYEIINENIIIEDQDMWDSYRSIEIKQLPKEVINKYELLKNSDNKIVSVCKNYLISRGISKEVWEECNVRYDKERQVLVFPFTDILEGIYILRMRAIKDKAIWTVSPKIAGFPDMIFPTIKQVGVFFGMILVDFSKPVVVVEGPIDAMRLMSLGLKNVIASGTSCITKEQIRSICSDIIILGMDADKAGKKAHNKIKNMVGEDVVLYELDWSLAKKENGDKCKDAGDLVKKADLIHILKNKKKIT